MKAFCHLFIDLIMHVSSTHSQAAYQLRPRSWGRHSPIQGNTSSGTPVSSTCNFGQAI